MSARGWVGSSPGSKCSDRIRVVGALLAAAAVLTQPARGQSGNLREKLKELNVRLPTEHYLLAGTVTDVRLKQYGQALEAMYREYEKGFVELLKDQDKDANRAANAKGGKKAGTGKAGDAGADEADRDGDKKAGRPSSGGSGTKGEAAPAGPALDQDDEAGRSRVIVFATRNDYQNFGQEYLGRSSEFTNGMYVPSADVLLILDQGNFNDTYEVLFHEAFHQFMRRFIKNPPIWLNEGLATHYGCARPGGRGITFSRPPALRWQLVRKVVESKRALPLWDVVKAGGDEFYDHTRVRVSGFDKVTRSSLYYGEAYTLVHLLLSDPSGRERLQKYIRDLAKPEGKTPQAITQEYFGPAVCEHLTPAWIKYINSRPENK